MAELARISSPFILIIELIMVLAATSLICLRARKQRLDRSFPVFVKVETLGAALAQRRALAILTVGLFVITLRAALIPLLGVPSPRWNDEFSYLLAADTFAHGRITNPTPPLWQHFESFHIILQPSYMSMYPPGEGLVLALGQALGNPWLGQSVVTAAMCSAICWMLQGWLPSSWAFFGGILAALRLGILSYWMNGYWSAGLPALAGALVLGAMPRVVKHARLSDALWLSLGVAVLANTRPYEGLLLSIPVAMGLGAWLLRDKRIWRPSVLSRFVLPVALLLGTAAAATGYYYYRVTGNPFRMAYHVNREAYSMAPYFLWQSPRPEPQYRHSVMRDFYRHELREFEAKRTLRGGLRFTGEKVAGCWAFFLGPALTIPLLAFPAVLRDRRMRFVLYAGAFFLLGLAVETWTMPHYFAPATGLLYIVLIQCMRHLQHWRWRLQPVGAALVQMVLIICMFMIGLRIFAVAANVPIEPPWPRGDRDRARIAQRLNQTPGQHLVMVRYGSSTGKHDLNREWVYNAADIDTSKIVWARDMGESRNQELIQYFKDRNAWIVNADDTPPQLQPYKTSP